jgi:hypothetical protein
VDADLDTLATGLYVTSDDFLADNPQYRPLRPRVGLAPRLTDAELVTLVVLQALLGFTSEARFLRYANTHLRGLFPYLPTQSGYNKRIRAAIGTLRAVIAHLVARTSSVSDDVWVVDSTPVECGRSRETAKRSDLAGWAEYGYCASHSRFFWGLRLHLVCTLSGLPVAFALVAAHPNQKLMADKNYYGKAFEGALADAEVELLRPARNGEKPRPGHRYFKPFRQVIESINNTLKTQLDLERHGGRTIAGVTSRVLQRILALTAAIWHNDQLGQPTLRSLTTYDH